MSVKIQAIIEPPVRFKSLIDCLEIEGIDLERRAITIACTYLDPKVTGKWPTIEEIKSKAAEVCRQFADNFERKP